MNTNQDKEKDMSRYKVKLRIFRGADNSPFSVRHVRVLAQSALDAICRAEERLNVILPDNEYAAGYAVWPLGRLPSASQDVSLPLAA
jgi:hypothetical protein